MNGLGGDATWKEKLHFNDRSFKSRPSPDGQKCDRISNISLFFKQFFSLFALKSEKSV